jgi:hypothetical protein
MRGWTALVGTVLQVVVLSRRRCEAEIGMSLGHERPGASMSLVAVSSPFAPVPTRWLCLGHQKNSVRHSKQICMPMVRPCALSISTCMLDLMLLDILRCLFAGYVCVQQGLCIKNTWGYSKGIYKDKMIW